jgi:DNA-binding SARP family transcriptional activator
MENIMASLQITLFGSFQVRQEDRCITPKLSPINQTLFAYLLLNRHRTFQREVLAGLLWGDYSHQKAHNCLNTAVWRLRQVLEPQGIPVGTYFLSTPQRELGFNTQSDYWLDVGVFEEQARRFLAHTVLKVDSEEIQSLEKTMQLYTGDLLEGHYDDWVLYERERMRCYYLSCLNYLMNYYSDQGLYEIGLDYGRQILNLDIVREEVHRLMMRLYLKIGQRALAVRQYDQCQQALFTELGILPMVETQQLYRSIVQDSLPTSGLPGFASSSVQLTLGQLNDAIQNLRHAQHDLTQASSTIKKLAGPKN